MKGCLLIALTLSGCASPQWTEVMANRGNGAPEGQCVSYSEGLQGKLSFPTQRVSWIARSTEPKALVRHCVLSYKVGKEVYFIDNISLGPRWVGNEGESIKQMAEQFYAPYRVHISDIEVK